jgi:predicted MPP superfamily phosphohydrolase
MFNHDDPRTEQQGAADASLTLRQYIPPPESAATSSSVRDVNCIPLPGSENPCGGTVFSQLRCGWWLQLGSTRRYQWNQYRLIVPRMHPSLEGFRITHLADLHLKALWEPALDTLIQRLRDNPPDLIVCTGDFVDHKFDSRSAIPYLERLIPQLSARLGIFAVTGNHDGDLLPPVLLRLGIHLLNERYLKLQAEDGAAIELIGLAGTRRYDLDPQYLADLPPRRAGMPRIVLGHFPDMVRSIGHLHADAMLSGHTHGGQVCPVPGIALISHDSLPKTQVAGIHRINGTTLITSRGMGVGKHPIRVFCPAEVIELHLTGAI